ncbi:MAG: mechanosensitive ion channel [Roseibium sp.]|nr:mechanosensitive ion channel [Roseibium sp.]
MRSFGPIVIVLLVFWSLAPAAAQDAPPEERPASTTELQDASDALLRLLEDPEGRAALIEYLKTAPPQSTSGEATPSDADQSGVDDTAATQDQAFVLRLGEYTRLVADDLGQIIERIGHSVKGLSLLADGTLTVRWDRLLEAMFSVAAVLASATLVLWAGQWILAGVHKRFEVRARYGGWTLRAGILVFTSLLDAGTVLLGWAAGYAVALASFGGLTSGVSLLESLALNAFLITGLAKAALRFIFAPNRPALRLLPFEDDAAIYWARWLGFVFAWLSYGLMLAVPVANQAISFVIGNAVRFFVVLIGTAIMIGLIARNRARVAAGATAYAERLYSEIAKRSMLLLGRVWHIGAYFYVVMVFLVWLFRPFDAMAIILRSTGLSVLTIMGGVLISLITTRAITGGIRLPQELQKSLPALQGRLNAFVPRILRVFRLAVFVSTLLILLDIWGIVSFFDWITSPDGTNLASRFGSAFIVLLAAFAVWLAVMSWVDLRLRERSGYIVTARERTLFKLFRNAFSVVVLVLAGLLALSEIGVNIGPLIAGAGVVGLAISFGAQTLVKDIITGAFIQIENAINEGDVVTVAGTTGVVERLTVRSVRVRDLDGTAHIVPFSSVDMVSNFMRDFSYHVAVLGVAYDTDIRKAKVAMEEAFRRLKDSEHGSSVLGDLEMHGVTAFGASAIDIRARIKTLPGAQWGVGRAYNEFVKDVFDERGIEIPFPQVTYHAAKPPVVDSDQDRAE